MSRVFLFWLGQEKESGSLFFLALFQGSGLSFLLLVNVMSYVTSTILSTLSTGVSTATGCILISPVVRTVNKSSDLLEGIDLF